ncbi:hypothetical protein D9M68_786080 [compost metagenome]
MHGAECGYVVIQPKPRDLLFVAVQVNVIAFCVVVIQQGQVRTGRKGHIVAGVGSDDAGAGNCTLQGTKQQKYPDKGERPARNWK